ncbi:hypothetical protein HMPREF1870_02382 [Bacteroidales bacterium KA00344]|nr:hypothetical protein HMPREF1870_02382 [Bacteroidales bacterium KA00344]
MYISSHLFRERNFLFPIMTSTTPYQSKQSLRSDFSKRQLKQVPRRRYYQWGRAITLGGVTTEKLLQVAACGFGGAAMWNEVSDTISL